MRQQRRLGLVAAVTSAVLVLAGCSSAPTSSPPPVTSPTSASASSSGPLFASELPSSPDDSPTVTSPATPDLTPLAATFSAPDGTTVTMDLQLSRLLRVTDPGIQAAWSRAGGSSLACDADPQRDALYVGQVAFTNTTPSFTPDLMIFFNPNMSGLTNLSVGVGYTNQPTCTAVAPSTNQATLAPAFSSPQWGPVPIELVVHDFYSPQFPGGNVSMLPQLDPTVNATVGQPINGVAYKVSGLPDGVLRLESLR